MGSPLGPTFANAFLCYHEQNWLNNCPTEFKPVYFKRYVDDIFVLFSSPDHLPKFQNYLNKCHPNISFTSETEKSNKLSFLDISITRDVDRKFITSIYRKPTFSGVYTHFDSFIPESYKFGLIYTLLHRCFKICSSWSIFHHEVIRIKDIFIRNGYPELFIGKVIKHFFSISRKTKEVTHTAEKKNILIVLPFLGKTSLQTRTKLEKLFKSTLHCCKLSVVFRTHTRLSNFFRFKDLLPKELKSGVIYKYKCSGCNATYIGETSRHLKVRASEHLGVSPLTGKKSTSSNCTAIKDHLKACHTTSSLDDFSILSRGNNRYLLEIKESLFIMRDSPQLNNNIRSAPLYLYN
ncbi:uncharacterized protein LOC130642384 [Hydractinia symbiolongicarpus]|uniref:uncharacterized protein LOC130642384 n=1 Tax=Hydractinia symbiolongicarpus TaxID=13093 RepID=UPI00254D4456|nr:uncharacterized protein LOC130642384 [Hydractinia symbiolongicarpus]